MNKLIALLWIVSIYGFQASAEIQVINNNSFEEVKNNVPVNWAINEYFKKNNKLGTIQLLSESAQDGKNCLLIKNDTTQVFHLIGGLVAATPNDVLRMSAYVKGKGSFRLSIYMYNSENAWLDGLYPQSVKVECSDWEKKDFEIIIPDKEFGAKGKVAEIRPVIVVDSDSEICLDNFSGQIEKAAAVAAGEPGRK